MKAVTFNQFGGPEVLSLTKRDRPEPEPDEVLVQVSFAGVNFIDTIHRNGIHRETYEQTSYFGDSDSPGTVSGMEGAGTIESTGRNVAEFEPGDRVAFWNAEGSYREFLTIKPSKLVPVPNDISLEAAASVLLQGLTADYLSRDAYEIREDDTVLVHAGAGGVGELLVQESAHRGARVFATCSSAQKSKHIQSLGGEPIRYDRQSFVDTVHRKTSGRGVDTVYDSVGRTTFRDSIETTRTRGTIVYYGQSSGTPDPLQPRDVLGSRTLTTCFLKDYVGRPDILRARSRRIFNRVRDGDWKRTIDTIFELIETPEAHERMEHRESIGKILLTIS